MGRSHGQQSKQATAFPDPVHSLSNIIAEFRRLFKALPALLPVKEGCDLHLLGRIGDLEEIIIFLQQAQKDRMRFGTCVFIQ